MLMTVRVDGAANEWCLVELQGELIPNDGGDMADVTVGSLWFEHGVPTMRIGNHIVAGKVAKLPKPFAVLERQIRGGDGRTEGNDVDIDASSSSSSSSLEDTNASYDVVGIARTRVIFSNRPKPVLT